MAMRIAAAGTQVGLSEAQILGFCGGAVVGRHRGEMGGSAFFKALVNMEVAAATGGESLEDFAACRHDGGGVQGAVGQRSASAFQAFIVGLSKMDEEGASAIATLNEIGINEIRLRDTLLRATNATELFAGTQAMANAAWEENAALTEEAGKRYATTESRLVNLKNKAVLFGQQIGDDLNPMIQNLIDGTGELIDKFLEMDESPADAGHPPCGIAASIGPCCCSWAR
jgi:TP901 family phage tail tape measure protein